MKLVDLAQRLHCLPDYWISIPWKEAGLGTRHLISDWSKLPAGLVDIIAWAIVGAKEEH